MPRYSTAPLTVYDRAEFMHNLKWYHRVFLKMDHENADDEQDVRNAWQLYCYETKPSQMRAFNRACELYRLNYGGIMV